ncbi:MAG: phosphatase PAP2 family protein [Pseudomonadota bacterium]|nr:phosphatase PAP2 family protein [Pseudomonadota bacterium]
MAVLLAATLLASPLFDLLNSDAVRRFDRAAWEFGRSLSGPGLLAVMTFVSALHGTVGILVLTAMGAWNWRRCGHLDAGVRLLLVVPAGMLLNVLVKVAIHRVRPDWALVDLPRSFSFPSGHVAETTVFYGSLALETIARGGRKIRRLAVALGAMTMIALVASSRIILGVHFLSDCVGAAGEGALWLAACFFPWRAGPAAAGTR